MNIAFFGTSDIGIQTLNSLNKHFNVSLVITTPDKIGKRNKTLIESPIKKEAQRLNIRLAQPQKFDDSLIEQLIDCDLGVLFSYGKIIPERVIDVFKYGILNIHPSLLPKYRGASPIISAILNGDTYTGVSIIKLTNELDAGDILMQKVLSIDDNDDNITLSNKVSLVASNMIVCAIEYIEEGRLKPVPQKGTVSYTKKISKSDAYIDFVVDDAKTVMRKIKAFVGYIEAFFRYNGKIYKVLKAHIVDKDATPGTILEVSKNTLIVACKHKSISIEIIKPEGKNAMPIEAFLAGHRLQCGQKII